MYNCNIKTIPHELQRYETCGDYWTEGGCIQFRVTSLGNADYEFLIAMHELIEKQFARKLGISEQTIDAWDLAHEEEEEPGAMLECPYREAHMMAEAIERVLATKLGVDWEHYAKTIRSVMENTRIPLDPTVRDRPDAEVWHKGQKGKVPKRLLGGRIKVPKGKIKERSLLQGK